MPKKSPSPASTIDQEPWWPTSVLARKSGGRVVGTNRSVWLYMKSALAPVVDARSPHEAMLAGEPVRTVLEEIAAATRVRLHRRSVAKTDYREVHILLVNVPVPFSPPTGSELRGHLAASFGGTNVLERVLLVGVRLKDSLGGTGGLRGAIDSVSETLFRGGVPLSDFDEDFRSMSALMTRSGLQTMTDHDFNLANAWWNQGHSPDTPMLVHDDHLHVFTSTDSMHAASRLVERGETDCDDWSLAQHHTLTFGTVQDFDIGRPEATSPGAQWAAGLVHSGAVCVSIRGKIEPPAVTRAELRRGKKKFLDDIAERQSQNKMARAEQEELLSELDDLESYYAVGGPATLMDCSTIVATSGRVGQRGHDMSEFAPGVGLNMLTMVSRQNQALAETWLASPVRANPYLHDLPSITIAASGLTSLSQVGDRDGAMLGFTEMDRQPAFLSPTAAGDEDQVPISIVVGQSGSGKTLTMLYLADQFARMESPAGGRTPVIVIDPKLGSDHSAVIEAAGGSVASLDDLMSADGIFDPLRFSSNSSNGVELAASMLAQINPWGPDLAQYEVPIQRAIAFGVENGADCVGRALHIALEAGAAPADMVKKVDDLAESSPMFRACVGYEQGGRRLRAGEGVTLIKVGNAHLDLPAPGQDIRDVNINQRIALALVRMMVFGSAAALAMRSGVLMLDEAWVMLGAGRTEVERLGRLARSQQVLPMMFTQRITDALNAGLAGYISRGLILPIQDPDEAVAACQIFKLEPTPERLERITGRATLGAAFAEDGVAPNWNSMRALRDPRTGQVLRGAVGIYVDLAGRAVPVEIALPSTFLKLASTNPDDIRRREAERSHPLTKDSHV